MEPKHDAGDTGAQPTTPVVTSHVDLPGPPNEPDAGLRVFRLLGSLGGQRGAELSRSIASMLVAYRIGWKDWDDFFTWGSEAMRYAIQRANWDCYGHTIGSIIQQFQSPQHMRDSALAYLNELNLKE